MGEVLPVLDLLARMLTQTVAKALRTRRNGVVERRTCVIDRLVLDTRQILEIALDQA